MLNPFSVNSEYVNVTYCLFGLQIWYDSFIGSALRYGIIGLIVAILIDFCSQFLSQRHIGWLEWGNDCGIGCVYEWPVQAFRNIFSQTIIIADKAQKHRKNPLQKGTFCSLNCKMLKRTQQRVPAFHREYDCEIRDTFELFGLFPFALL